MHMTGSRDIGLPPEEVYAALLNPEALKASVPGCTALDGSAEAGFDATVTQKVGPVKATFRGHVAIDDQDPPNGLTLSGEGKGGPAGFARGGAKVRLEAIPGGTRLSYDVDAAVGGKLAQLGSRIVDAFASRMADQFFTNFVSHLGAPELESAEAEVPAPAPAATAAPEPEPAPTSQAAPEPVAAAVETAAPETTKPKERGFFARLFGKFA